MLSSFDTSITIRNLIRARDLIKNPDHWLQHDHIVGNRCCASGAVYQCIEPFVVPTEWRDKPFAARPDSPRGTIPEEYWFLRLALSEIDPDGPGYIGAYNDTDGRTHSEVMQLFDRAISLCVAEHLDAA